MTTNRQEANSADDAERTGFEEAHEQVDESFSELDGCAPVAEFGRDLPCASTRVRVAGIHVSLYYRDDSAIVLVDYPAGTYVRATTYAGSLDEAHTAVVDFARYTDADVDFDEFGVLDRSSSENVDKELVTDGGELPDDKKNEVEIRGGLGATLTAPPEEPDPEDLPPEERDWEDYNGSAYEYCTEHLSEQQQTELASAVGDRADSLTEFNGILLLPNRDVKERVESMVYSDVATIHQRYRDVDWAPGVTVLARSMSTAKQRWRLSRPQPARLLYSFGSVDAVAKASQAKLEQVEGIGPKTAARIVADDVTYD